MSMIRLFRPLVTGGGALVLLLLVAPASFGQFSCEECCDGCHWWNCPPQYKYCMEGPPRICVKCACPKPVCCPANAPNWGYFQTCWRPYPWPPDWSHCYGTPPASQIVPPFASAGAIHAMPPAGELPSDLPGPKTLKPGL
jgi:hypothetical protein